MTRLRRFPVVPFAQCPSYPLAGQGESLSIGQIILAEITIGPETYVCKFGGCYRTFSQFKLCLV